MWFQTSWIELCSHCTKWIISNRFFIWYWRYYISIPIAGLYNIYNALAAYSAAKFFGLSTEEIQEGFSKAQRVFGRQETFDVGKIKKVMLNLIKTQLDLTKSSNY